MKHFFTDLNGVTHEWETEDFQIPLDAIGALLTLFAITPTPSIEDLANIGGLTPADLVAEAEAWAAAKEMNQ